MSKVLCTANMKAGAHLLLIFALFASAFLTLAQSAPGNLRVKSTTQNSITVTWSGAPGIDAYGINYRSENGDERHAGRTSGTSFTIKGLSANTRYTIFVDWPPPGPSTNFLQVSGRTDAAPRKPKIPKGKPLAVTCPHLPPDITVSGYGQFTQCKQVGAAGVALPALIQQGVLEAVDVFGAIPADMQVCFHMHGQLKFLDAATSPRAASNLAPSGVNGMTCTRIDRPGTVILMQDGEPQAELSPTEETPFSDSVETATVQSCGVATTANLSLRAGPSVYFMRLDAMPGGTRLRATARSGDWFMVKYDGQMGWASGLFLAASPECAGLVSGSRVFLPALRLPARDESAEPASSGDQPAPSIWGLIDCRLTTGDIVNLRSGAGLEHDVIWELPFRTHLIAIDRDGDWFHVEYFDEVGWVHIDVVFRRGACG